MPHPHSAPADEPFNSKSHQNHKTTNPIVNSMPVFSIFPCRPENFKVVICTIDLVTWSYSNDLFVVGMAASKSHEIQRSFQTYPFTSDLQCCFDSTEFIHLCWGKLEKILLSISISRKVLGRPHNLWFSGQHKFSNAQFKGKFRAGKVFKIEISGGKKN